MEKYHSAVPYSRIAPYYDHMMNHVDYAMWSRYIDFILDYYAVKARRIIDLSCGTGSFMLRFPLKGRIVLSGDLSMVMLKEAVRKGLQRKLPLFCADVRQLPFADGVADVILFLYDSINYLIENDAVISLLQQTYRVLRSGGVFIFDVVTPYICRKEFMDYFESHVQNGEGYERRGWFNEEEQIQYNEFIVHHKGRKYLETHRQKIRSLREWDDLIGRTPFRVSGRLNEFTFRSPNRRSGRVHYVCEKR